MERMNWKTVLSNISEAREQLQDIENSINKKQCSEEELEISLRHAYHHLNVAWNARHAPTKDYANMTDENFKLWGKYPQEMDLDY